MVEVIDEVPFGEDPNIYIDPESALKDDMDADACLQKIGNWEKFRKFWLDFYEKKIEEVNNKVDTNIAFNRRKLQAFFATVPHRTTKAKTQEVYDLPSGKLSVVYKKPGLTPDKKSIIDRLKTSGEMEYIKTTEDLDWKSYKERLFISEDGHVVDSDTGEVITDVEINQAEPEFKVTPNKKGEENNGRESDAEAV